MGLAATGIGTYLNVKAAGDATAARVRADQLNAGLADAQGANALQLGTWQAGRIRQRAGEIAAAQRAGYASSGVDESVGSAAQVQAGTRAQGALDALMAQNNAARQAWGYKVTSQQYRNQAQADDISGRYAQTGALLGGLGQAEQQAGQALTLGFGA